MISQCKLMNSSCCLRKGVVTSEYVSYNYHNGIHVGGAHKYSTGGRRGGGGGGGGGWRLYLEMIILKHCH